MLVTEAKAREKWCPMVRIARHEVVTIERATIAGLTPVSEQHHIVAGCNTDALGRTRIPVSCRCIASDCMMWEPAEAPILRSYIAVGAGDIEPSSRPSRVPASWKFLPASEGDDGIARWIEPDTEHNARRTGRCGLINP